MNSKYLSARLAALFTGRRPRHLARTLAWIVNDHPGLAEWLLAHSHLAHHSRCALIARATAYFRGEPGLSTLAGTLERLCDPVIFEFVAYELRKLRDQSPRFVCPARGASVEMAV